MCSIIVCRINTVPNQHFHLFLQAIPQEHPNAPTNMGLSPFQLLVAQNDTYSFVQGAISTLASNGRYIWQGFDGNRQGDPDSVASAPTASNCQAYM